MGGYITLLRNNMNQLITKTTSRSTIGNITANMYQPIKPEYYRLSREDFTDIVEDYSDLSIRWGCTSSIGTDIRYEVNKREAIKLVCNKGRCRQFLYDQGILVPEPVNLQIPTDNDFPMIVRPSFHQRGRNFLLFNNLHEYLLRHGEVRRLRRPYASRFFPKTKEYRVHVAHGKVLLVQEKLQTSPGPSALNWNHENGYVFGVVRWKDYRNPIVRLAVDTIEAVGLNFGAVDILADPTDISLLNAVVCEINTAPKLEGYTARRYAQYFDWLITNKETKHFHIPEGTPARHYVFKNRELNDCEYDFGFI